MSKNEDRKTNRYLAIIEQIFLGRYRKGDTEVPFDRDEIVNVARKLRITLPKNLGDLIYTFRYHMALPSSISDKAPAGSSWIIRPAGRSRYVFVATTLTSIVPNSVMTETKIPDATPGLIGMYAQSDEQALLAKLRYNRLIDIFTGITCYSLQSHLRTSIPTIGQLETDEIYIGVDRRGAHYVIPVQAKGGRDQLNIVQIEQDLAMCHEKFVTLICRPVAAQFIDADLIALFAFEPGDNGVSISMEKHYRLVPREQMTPEDIQKYQRRLLDE
ncbi:MAG: endonuclease [Phycisphaerales bacterium]|nr:endonuclease [Phycisphaerales bacterium]